MSTPARSSAKPTAAPAAPTPADNAVSVPADLPRSFFVSAEGKAQRDLPLADVNRVITDKLDGHLWVDIDVTNRHHVAVLENVCRFHPLTVEDTLNPNSRVKLEEYPGYLFMIIRGVKFYEKTDDPYDLETFNLCFYLGRRFLVTVHAGQSASVDDVAHRINRNPDLLTRGVDRVAHAVMDSAIDAYFPILDQLDEFVDGLEKRVFESFDQSALRDIFEVKRLVLSLRRHLAPEREVFNVLTNRPSSLLSSESQIYFRDIYDHVLRINDSIETYRDLLSSTLDSYLTQVSNRLGTITKGLSVIATLSIPFVVVSGMWGMNFQHIPLATHPHAFWWMLGLQLAIGAVLLIILRARRLI
jgi:magnesium transporter